MTTTEIHVRFSRTCDAADAFPTLSGHVAGATLAGEGIEVACDPLDEARILRELEHALDEWLAERELPFTPLELDDHTVLVRPPGS
jgi:hypothetical protein